MGVRRIGRRAALVLAGLVMLGMLLHVQAGSGVKITYSSDGEAFTTNSGDTTVIWYEKGTTVNIREVTGGPSIGVGEHVYIRKRTGVIPIAYWKVTHPYGKCIHNDYNVNTSFHGIDFGRAKCGANYYSGWTGYCADCGEAAVDFLIYMNAETAAALTELRVGMGYYYLCPWCRNLEQAREIKPHICRAVSANRYRIVYEANGGSGDMVSSIHMYNNATVYEGREVSPQTSLSLCTFKRIGYCFAGWNSKPDGSGQSFCDGEEIRNLSDQEDGQVVLYAQWRRNRSVLQINPAGGSYQGNKGITAIEGDYESSYLLDSSKITPPAGYTVSFDTDGGKPVSSITGKQVFKEWSIVTPSHGQLKDNVYHFLGDNHSMDTVTAVYIRESIILPSASKSGKSFGGWYYDRACSQPAGSAGSSFTPSGDMTLYAGWVELQLQTQDNYSANGGKGAVDLSWSQQDNRNKSYRLYQQREGQNWQQISSATDIGITGSVSRNLTYTGKTGSYQIPYNGFYQLTLTGAQGGNYGSYSGGKGGMVQGTFYFSRGELLTYELGGQNGYHGGGIATVYAGGGGYSEVTSDRQGTLLIAGGGGGATQAQSGMPGGSAQNTISGHNGENGKAGGGGGYEGGIAGNWLTHQHTDSCRHVHSGDAVNGGGCYTVPVECGSTSFRQEVKRSVFYYGNRDNQGNLIYCPRCGSYSCPGHRDYFYRYICTKCGVDHDENKPAVCTAHTGYKTGCGKTDSYICGMTEGQILSSVPAYGGSNYINTANCRNYTDKSGWQNGNGTLQISSVALGYLESNLLNGVTATDFGKPEIIDIDSVRLIATDENTVKVSFARPADTGTTYYHKVESYPLGSEDMLCCSNVSVNTLKTQVQGYRYVVDRSAGTIVNNSHQWYGEPGTNPFIMVKMKEGLQYLHIAAQDKAGNLGKTIHIALSDQTVIFWPVRTSQLQLEQQNNVYPAKERYTYYVRAGENIPFSVSFTGALCGAARKDYQITHLFFASQDLSTGGQEGRLGVVTPIKSNISEGNFTYQASQLRKISEGQSCVGDGAYVITRRSNTCRDLEILQKLYVSPELDGHMIRLTPVAAVKSGNTSIVSDYSQDLQNSIRLLIDGRAPSISGMDQLEKIDFVQEAGETVEVELRAADEGSGLAEFYAEVYNQDNGSYQCFSDEGNGRIHIHMSSQDALYSGNFSVTVHAVDRVGNEAIMSSQLLGLSLSVKLERTLEPHDPVFKAGESGVLTIITTGYVERVEVLFPEEMTALDPSLNRSYDYPIPDFIKEEKISFMVPLRMPEGVASITVRAYKADTQLQQHPELVTFTVKGNVLDELRTRLK